MAKTFGSKFDIISPVWLQIVRLGDLRYEVRGMHDVVELKTADNPETKSNYLHFGVVLTFLINFLIETSSPSPNLVRQIHGSRFRETLNVQK